MAWKTWFFRGFDDLNNMSNGFKYAYLLEVQYDDEAFNDVECVLNRKLRLKISESGTVFNGDSSHSKAIWVSIPDAAVFVQLKLAGKVSVLTNVTSDFTITKGAFDENFEFPALTLTETFNGGTNYGTIAGISIPATRGQYLATTELDVATEPELPTPSVSQPSAMNQFKILGGGFFFDGNHNPLKEFYYEWTIGETISGNNANNKYDATTDLNADGMPKAHDVKFNYINLKDNLSVTVTLVAIPTYYKPGVTKYSKSFTTNIKQYVPPIPPSNLKIESLGLEYGSGKFIDKLKFSWDAAKPQNNNSFLYAEYVLSAVSDSYNYLGTTYENGVIYSSYDYAEGMYFPNDAYIPTSVNQAIFDTSAFYYPINLDINSEVYFTITARTGGGYSSATSEPFKLSGASVPGPFWVKKDGEWQEGEVYVKTSDADDPWKAGAIFVKTADGWKGIY